MYEAFFQFHRRPFCAAPDTTCYFPAATIENSRQTLLRCIDRAEGAGLIIGPPGTGKTLLCRMIVEEFQDRFGVAMLTSGRLTTPEALLQSVLYELREPYRGLNEGELRLALVDRLQPREGGDDGLLLIIDEAHAMPWRLLDEVRMISNLVRNGQPRVRVVLAGGPLLEERFAHPKMSSFSQRLAGRCYLEAMDGVETAEYVQTQVTAAGGNAKLFDADALRSIYRATDGIPRLINQLCDHALLLAHSDDVRQLTSDAIDEAWADLQQLPSPWNGVIAPGGEDQVIEFGGLDDEDDEEPQDNLPEAIPFSSAPARPAASPSSLPLHEVSSESISTIENSFEFGPPTIEERGAESGEGTSIQEVSLPKINLPDLGDPFSETFAEEIVLVDRYAESELFAGRLRVSTLEGLQLGSLLAPACAPPRRANLTLAVPPAEAPSMAKDVTEAKEVVEPVATLDFSEADAFSPASDPVLPEVVVEVSAPGAETSPAPAAHDQDRVVAIDAQQPSAGPRAPASSSGKPAYRQLFSRLRRS